jgi:hypothetical protein
MLLIMKFGSKNWPYVIGLAGAAAVAYLWLAPRLVKPGFHMPATSMHVAPKRSYPAMVPMPMAGGMMMARKPVGESGGTIPVGGGPAGVTGGGGDFMYPSGMIGKPGGYGISGGYFAAGLGGGRLSVA